MDKYTRLIWTWELISGKCSETEFLLYLELRKKEKYPDKNISPIKEIDLKTQATLVQELIFLKLVSMFLKQELGKLFINVVRSCKKYFRIL